MEKKRVKNHDNHESINYINIWMETKNSKIEIYIYNNN